MAAKTVASLDELVATSPGVVEFLKERKEHETLDAKLADGNLFPRVVILAIDSGSLDLLAWLLDRVKTSESDAELAAYAIYKGSPAVAHTLLQRGIKLDDIHLDVTTVQYLTALHVNPLPNEDWSLQLLAILSGDVNTFKYVASLMTITEDHILQAVEWDKTVIVQQMLAGSQLSPQGLSILQKAAPSESMKKLLSSIGSTKTDTIDGL